MSAPTTPSPTPQGRWRSHAVTLAFGTFVVGTDAYVIAGVLPDIADALNVSVAAAGQLVTVFAIAYAVLAPVLAGLTSHWPRRGLLVTALVTFAVGNAVTALAPGYASAMCGRVVAAAGAAMFTPNAGATAAHLSGPERRGQAFSIVTMGLSSSLVLGAPLGTLLGQALGWQATMWFVAALGIAVVPLLALRLPEIRLASGSGFGQRMSPLTDRKVLGVLLVTVVAFIGIFIPYTYISEVYAPVTAGHDNLLTILLLVFGVAGTAGNLVAGSLADRQGPRRVVSLVTLALAAVFVVTVAARNELITALPVIVVSGWLSWSVLAPQQRRIVDLAPREPALSVALNASGAYVGISLSAVVGAIGLDAFGAARLPLLAAGVLVLASALTWVTGGRTRQVAAEDEAAGSGATRGTAAESKAAR
ncbi:MFS transporter [Streptomyces sp. 7N604]|uniref:MFS transporter n=1 Tax=Streptomyces sp. 7N604 TaxID=3457415 RepID=UPI003FCFC968